MTRSLFATTAFVLLCTQGASASTDCVALDVGRPDAPCHRASDPYDELNHLDFDFGLFRRSDRAPRRRVR